MEITEPKHPARRLAALLLSLFFMLSCLPSALAVSLNVDAGFYFKQSRGGTCTLASAAMMLRRRAYMDGLEDWFDVTENSVRSSAWSGGLVHSFTYNAMQVGYATLPQDTAQKTQTLIDLLNQHPEGIVAYDRTRPHAVLLTDYTDGVFYCADPAGSVSQGRIPLSQARVSLGGISCYWFVCDDQNGLTATGDGLRLVGMRYPENVRQGSGVSLTGTVGAAPGTVLTEVEAAVLDAAGQTLQSAAAAPGTDSWSFQEIDSQIRFGELPAGSYSYMVLVTQSDGQSICFMSDFTVTDAATSTVSYWSAQDSQGEKLVRTEEETAAQPAEGSTAQLAEGSASSVLEGLFGWLNTSF